MPTATAASIAVKLFANTKQFVSGMSKASKVLSSFKLGLVGGAVAGGAAAAAFALYIRAGLKAVDATTKMAQSVGIATDRWIGLELAASQSGVAIDQVHTAVAQMTRRIGEAEQGLGEGTRALKALNLQASDLIQLAPQEAFGKIADALNDVPNTLRRNTLAMQIFGRSALNVNNLLRQGSAGIAAFDREARELGITFTAGMANRAEQAIDALDKLKRVFLGFRNQLAIVVAPAVTAVVDKLLDWIKGMGGAQVAAVFLADKVLAAFSLISQATLSLTATLVGNLSKIIGGLSRFSDAFAEVAEDLNKARDSIKFAEFDVGIFFADARRSLAAMLEESKKAAVSAGKAIGSRVGAGAPPETVGNRFVRGEINPQLIDPSALSRAGRPVEIQSTQLDNLVQLVREIQTALAVAT